MNCKPNDIARIVNNVTGNNDKLVRVAALVTAPDCAVAWWLCVAMQQIYIDGVPGLQPAGTEVYCADVNLRPIRDPGDDAVDQTLAWLPVPLPAINPALLETSVSANESTM